MRVRVRFWNEEGESNAYTTDISDDGLLIESTRRLEPGERLHIELQFEGGSYFTEAVVARRQDYPQHAQSFFKPALGLRFLGLEEMLEAIGMTEPKPPRRDIALTEPRDPPTRPCLSPASWMSSGRPAHSVDLRKIDVLRALYERDISKGALLLACDPPPQIGTVLCVALRLPPPHSDVPVQGEVVSLYAGHVGLLLQHHRELSRHLASVLEAQR